MDDGIVARNGRAESLSNDISAFALGSVLLRRWRFVLAAMVIVGGLAAATALIKPAQYTATAAFLPQGADAARGGLAGLAGQLGVAIPTATQGPFYIELLGSPELLAPIVHDTLTVPEAGAVRTTLITLFQIEGTSPEQIEMRAIIRLKTAITAVDSRTGVVKVSVTTPWPSVSQRIAAQLIKRLNDFNLKTRQSQAGEERRFAGERVAVTRDTLRAVENRLKYFLQTNRQYASSPQLAFEHDRLQRETALYQAVLTNLTTAYEEARTREVRDTPVLTVIEPARLPATPDPTRWWLRAILGAVVGGMLSAFLALASFAVSRRRAAGDPEAEEFVALLGRVPGGRLLRRRAARDVV